MFVKLNNEIDDKHLCHKITATLHYDLNELIYHNVNEDELKNDFKKSFDKAFEEYKRKRFPYLFVNPA